MIKSIKSILLSILSVGLFITDASGAMLMEFWDTYINNDSSYYINAIEPTSNESGNIVEAFSKFAAPGTIVQAFSYSTNYYGNLSQDLSFDLQDVETHNVVGTCTLHAGLGSYFTMPNFNGSKCTLKNGDSLLVNPSFEINDKTYKVTYKLGQDKHVSRIIVFGDSLSDMGNLYRSHNGAVPKSPPYFRGHFSDGEIWLEYFSKHLNVPKSLISNYAYGGASINQTWRPIYGLEKQVGQYLNWNPTADSSALYVIWIGSNDFVYGVDEDVTTAVVKTINTVEAQLRLLIEHGSRHFLMPNLPNLGASPIAREVDTKNRNHNFSQQLALIASTYNAHLAQLLAKLSGEYTEVTFVSYDTYSLLNYAVKNYKQLGFNNYDDRCNPNGVNDFSQRVCSNPYEFVFWDGLHPTSHTHAILGEEIFKVMRKNGYKPNLARRNYLTIKNSDEITLRNQYAIHDLNVKLMIDDSEPLGLGFLNPEYIISPHLRK